ncbi:MAG: hypothetical protein QXQ82_02940 [Candidatus Pacearchaeota archaeon]
MKVISSFVAGIFGLVVAVVAFIGFALSKGYFLETLEKLPLDPSIYFIFLIVLGIVLMVISFTSKREG